MRNVNDPLPPARTILALDLGKFKSVACVLNVASNTHRFQTILTGPKPRLENLPRQWRKNRQI